MSGYLSLDGCDVLFAHWPIDPERLRSRVPEPLELDTFDGRAWLGVLAFEVAETGLMSLPFSLPRSFLQLTFRTYVRYEDTPGVHFFSSDTSDRLGTTLGERFLRVPLYHADMSLTSQGDSFAFRSRRTEPGAPPVRFEADYQPKGEPFQAASGSFEEFFVERHRYFPVTDGAREAVYEGEVQRDPWDLSDANATIKRNTLFRALGLGTPEEEPVFTYSPGFTSTTWRPHPVGDGR
jgi:hypothetical protein